MDKLNHPLARGVSYLLIYLTALQPVFAAGISVSHPATQAEAGTVPIINIATPNAAGISHNQYAEFNVGKTGAVLNNATEAGNSQLAGALTANPHLNDQGAALIINEVTSSSASELQGKLEVFGHSAGVMIANPNGIRCDGCGAINSPALTLTTGKPQFLAQGELQALEVRQGTVSVGPGGLDGSGQDYVDIISRATELNGKITAHNLALTQGVNRVDYPGGGVTALAASGSAPQLAIDTKALGGMYADKIRLLATENGVGVNLSNLTTHQQSITLTSSGQLQLSNISAKTDLNVSGRGITLSPGSSLTSGADITLAADQVTNSGTVVAAKDLRLFSDRVSNTGKGAQLRAGGGMWIQKNAAGERASLVENRSANISSGGDLVIRAGQLNNLRNAVVTGQQKAAADDKGMFIYGSAFNAAKYGNPNKRPDYDEGLRQYLQRSTSKTLVESFLSRLFDTWINDDSTHYFVQADAQPGWIQAGGNLYASSGTLLNAASELRAGGNMVLTGGSFDALSYHGGLQQDFVKFAHDFETDKTDGFKHINYLKTDEHRSALITDTAINSHITAAGELVADFKDHISASLPLPLTPTELTSAPRADTFSAKNILLHAGIISSNDGISATENLTLLADDSISQQRGRLSAGNSLSLTAVNNISNLQGNLKGRSVDMISRQGSILSGTPATSRSFSADYQQQFSILNAGTLSLTAGQHIALNDTQLLISDALSATSGGDLSILNSDKLLKGPDLLIKSDLLAQQQHLDQALVTPGRTHVTGDITLVAAGDLSLDGVSLNAGKNIALLAGKNVSLNPRSLSPDSHRTQKILDRYTEYDTDFFPTSRTPELRAVLAAGNDLQIHAGADLRTDGAKLTSGANATLIAGRNMSLGALAYSFIDNLNDNNKDDRQLVSEVQAAKNLTLTTNGDLTSAGSRLSAGGDLAVSSGGNMRFESVTTHLYREESKAWSESLTQNGSQLTSGGLLTLMANGSILFQATKLLAKGALEVAAQGGYLYAQAMEESSSYERTTHKRKWWGKKTTVRQTGHSQSNKVTEFSAAGDLTLLSRDDATFEASKISAGKNARLVSTGGKVNFLAVKNSAFAQTLTLSKGFFIKQSQRGYQADTWVLPSVYTGGTLTVEASRGISAEVKAASARQLQATLAVLGNAPGTEWLKGLSTRNDVQWQQVQDAYQQWSWSHRSLNPVVGAVIAIAAAAVTAGSGLAASVGALASSGSGGLAATAAYGAGYSGMMALSSQTAVALVENRGNLSKTFDTLSSSDSVKALATSMAIGGALAGFDQISDLQAANPGNARLPVLSNGDWINTAQRVAGQSVIRSVLNSTINGGSFGHNLSDALLATVGDQLNAEGAKLVGDNGELLGVAGKSLSHAVVAGIAAEISGGNATGAAAGAIGAELAGVMLGDSLIKPSEWQRQSEQQAQVARVLGATLGALVTGKASGAESGATGAEYAFRYNYLTHQQQQQMDEELAEAKTPYDKMAVTVNWGVVSDNQDDIFNAGVISGVSMDLWESAKGLAELASNPRELWVAFRNVINEDDGWARVGNNVKQGFLDRIDAGLTYYDQAGTDSAFSSGLEFGHLTSDVATAFLGVAGVAKGALKLGEVTAGAVLEDSATLRAPVVRQIDTGIEWEGGIQGQGMPWEDYVGKDLPAEARLPKNFDTFDYFNEKTDKAISVKTLNTATAARINNPKQIYYSMKKDIDDVVNFKDSTLSGRTVTAEMIKTREVNIAIPKATTDAQWAEINRAVQYGKTNNVNIKITVVK